MMSIDIYTEYVCLFYSFLLHRWRVHFEKCWIVRAHKTSWQNNQIDQIRHTANMKYTTTNTVGEHEYRDVVIVGKCEMIYQRD